MVLINICFVIFIRWRMQSIKLPFRFPCFIKRHISSRCEALAEIILLFAVCAVSVLALGRPAFFIQARFRCESYSTFCFNFGNSCSVCSSLPASLLCPNGTKFFKMDSWNKELFEHLVDDFEIVYPVQLRDRGRVGIDTQNYLFDNSTVHFERCSFVIKTSYGRWRIHVQLNDVLIQPAAKYMRYLKLDSPSETSGRSLPNCYYHGQVHGHPKSKVSLSTCFGLRGSIIMENQTFIIIPLKGGDLSRRHPHVFVRLKWDDEASCGNTDDAEWSRKRFHRRRPHRRKLRRDVEKEVKYIELGLFIDRKLHDFLNVGYREMTSYFLEAVNAVDLAFQQLNTRVSLVYSEIWTTENKIGVQREILPSLMNFIQFSSYEFYNGPFDLALLLTAADLTTSEMMSAADTVCSARAAGMIKVADKFQPYYLSLLMAHAIGHISGMSHDDSEFDCTNGENFIGIMNNVVSMTSKKNRRVYQFTECNKHDYLELIRSGQGRCLFNYPLQNSALTLCGNKVVDPGEFCDCGSVEECDLIDPCCDAVTCTLRADAQCAEGVCCEKCKFITNRTLCRPSRDECDVPEYCSGSSGSVSLLCGFNELELFGGLFCPSDSYKPNGAACGINRLGICYGGQCRQSDSECQRIWGPNASAADPACFKKFNTLGIDFGHCGVNENNKPLPCTESNAMCGLLFCKGGQEIPNFSLYFKTEFTENGSVYECKVFIDNKSPVNYSLIPDGSRCGKSEACISQNCVPLRNIYQHVDCPTTNTALFCSGHGICTNLNICHCDAGWTGRDCSVKLNFTFEMLSIGQSAVSEHGSFYGDSEMPVAVSFPDTFPSGDSSKLDTYAMLIILGCVAIGMILMRRANFSKKSKTPTSEKCDFEKESNSSTETGQRSIRFGPSRTYKCADEVMTTNKRRTLDQIRECDERESLSAKSRESGNSTERVTLTMNRLPSRGILKNGPQSFTCERTAPEWRALLAANRPCDNGYDSEPPYQQSSTFGRYVGVNGSGCWTASDDGRCPLQTPNSARLTRGGLYESFNSKQPRLNQTTAAIVSPYMYVRNRSLLKASPATLDSFSSNNGCCSPSRSRGADLAAYAVSPAEKQLPTTRCSTSPCNSTCSSSRGATMQQPKPLKLTNIELLLKQLDGAAVLAEPSEDQSLSSRRLS
ncbi:Disintegrin and metalloproteinase domain-containing protein 9 [Trichinella pseudospiralis]|uniref:Disintegrin and metalloproteinase domain-containing protein 9 n=1 Tax=Trichinella pseudospiralis TaxID=6337 RepID=A0A0V1K723_TRIPS|nr:Disintegrin and metalloproteinase domain-containing protein 9 [Trichinella pseudospiralis]